MPFFKRHRDFSYDITSVFLNDGVARETFNSWS